MSVAEELDRDALLVRENVRPIQLAHIVLRTPDMARMRDFYLTFLNGWVTYENDVAAFIGYDEEHHRLVVIGMPGLEPVSLQRAGLEHYAFTYATLGELLGTYERLKAKNIHPCWCINHGFTTSIYYRDPDGNMLETQYDNMDLPAANEFMRSDYFAKNSIGVDFDPELLVERYRRGHSISELIKFRAAPYPKGAPHIRPPEVPEYDCDGELL